MKVMVLEPCVDPNADPLTVTVVPTFPVVGLRLVIFGIPPTSKPTPLLGNPATVTTTLPVVAPLGTVATTDEALQLLIVVAAFPLNVTALEP